MNLDQNRIVNSNAENIHLGLKVKIIPHMWVFNLLDRGWYDTAPSMALPSHKKVNIMFSSTAPPLLFSAQLWSEHRAKLTPCN